MTTTARAAVLWGIDQPWKVQEIEVDDPKDGEVVVRWKAAGLCHSDEHLVTGDMVPPKEMLEMMGVDSFFPIIGGHEGAGVDRGRGARGAIGAGRRSRLGEFRAVVWPLPLLHDRSRQPVRRRRRDARWWDDHRRHPSPPRRRSAGDAARQARDLRRADLRLGDVGHQGRRRPTARLRVARVVRRRHRLGLGDAPADVAARRHRRRRWDRRHRHERRPRRQDGRRRSGRSPSTRWSSSARRRWSSARRTRSHRWTRRSPR